MVYITEVQYLFRYYFLDKSHITYCNLVGLKVLFGLLMETVGERKVQEIRTSIRGKLDQSALGPFAQYHQFLIPSHLIEAWHKQCDVLSIVRDVPLTPYSKLDFFFISPESDARMSFWRTPIGSLIRPLERGWQELRLFVQPANEGYDPEYNIMAHRLILENGKEPKLKNTISSKIFSLVRTQERRAFEEDLEHWKTFADSALDYNLNPHLGFGLPIVGQSK